MLRHTDGCVLSHRKYPQWSLHTIYFHLITKLSTRALSERETRKQKYGSRMRDALVIYSRSNPGVDRGNERRRRLCVTFHWLHPCPAHPGMNGFSNKSKDVTCLLFQTNAEDTVVKMQAERQRQRWIHSQAIRGPGVPDAPPGAPFVHGTQKVVKIKNKIKNCRIEILGMEQFTSLLFGYDRQGHQVVRRERRQTGA